MSGDRRERGKEEKEEKEKKEKKDGREGREGRERGKGETEEREGETYISVVRIINIVSDAGIQFWSILCNYKSLVGSSLLLSLPFRFSPSTPPLSFPLTLLLSL